MPNKKQESGRFTVQTIPTEVSDSLLIRLAQGLQGKYTWRSRLYLYVDDIPVGFLLAEDINPSTVSIHLHITHDCRTPSVLMVFKHECIKVLSTYFKSIGVTTVTSLVAMDNIKGRRFLEFLGMPTQGYYIGSVQT